MSLEVQLPTPTRTNPGFFENPITETKDFESDLSSKKAHTIATLLLCGTLLAGISTLFFVTLTSIAALGTPILISQITGFVIIPPIAMKSMLYWRAINKLTPPMNDLPFSPSAIGSPKVGQWHKGALKAYPLINSRVSNRYKLELLRNAKESILLSGCYCGGKVFHEALEIIRNKLEQGELKEAKILTSNYFLDKKGEQLLDALNKDFPEKFQAIVHAESDVMVNGKGIFYWSSCNHTKALVVDGSYAIIGGSGLEDSWSQKLDEKDVIKKFTPQAFHDYDYLMRSDRDGIVPLIYSQMRALFAIQKRRYKDRNHFESLKTQKFSLPFHSYKIDAIENGIETDKGKIKKIKGFQIDAAKILTSCGTQKENTLENEIVALLDSAKKTALISHMYFLPTSKILNAMERAIKRGVSFTVITNGHTSKSPGTHFGFVALSQYLLSKLDKIAAPGKLKVLENISPGYTWHHKIIATDDENVLFGSANLSDRSLRGIDFELSALVKSKELVAQTKKEISKQAMKACREVPRDKISKFSLTTKITALLQYFFLKKIV